MGTRKEAKPECVSTRVPLVKSLIYFRRFVLQGGFAGWARRYGEEKDLVQDMSKRMWTQTFSEMSPLMKMALTEPFDEDDEDDEEDFALYSSRKGT